MSKSIKWQYNEFIQSRKEKLINMLISEIIFLKKRFNETKNKDEMYHLKIALDKLDYLLNRLKTHSSDMPEEDFDKIVMLIYQIFKNIAESIE
ncbi:MAG: hypothetical protein ACFE9S_14245 [Candidatus Hermodarchaeota archaeon]